MINKLKTLPAFNVPAAEIIKIENLYSAYGDEAQLFIQNETGAILLLLDGGVIIHGDINATEVKQFLSFINPVSVFSSADNLKAIYGSGNFEEVNTIICEKPSFAPAGAFTYDPKSREIYDILSVDEFNLPPYEYFATDYCLRKNRGLIKVFAKSNTCAAITLESEKYRLLGGIATKQKGLGGALLLAAVNGNKPVLAVCRDELLPFYTKFGFKPLYKSGYWRKQI